MISALALLLPAWLPAQAPEQGVEFNGETSYAVVEDAAAFDLDAFSFAAWVKVRSQRRAQVFLNRGAAGGPEATQVPHPARRAGRLPGLAAGEDGGCQ